MYGENGGGNPPILPFFLHFLSLFVHYFLENVTTEPPITPQGGMVHVPTVSVFHRFALDSADTGRRFRALLEFWGNVDFIFCSLD